MPQSIVLFIVLLSNEGKSLSDLIQASYLMEVYVWTKKRSHIKNRQRPELFLNFFEVPGTEKKENRKTFGIYGTFESMLKCRRRAQADITTTFEEGGADGRSATVRLMRAFAVANEMGRGGGSCFR